MIYATVFSCIACTKLSPASDKLLQSTTTLSKHVRACVVTRMRKLVNENGRYKHFFLHLHRVITIRLNVGKFSTKRFKTSANEAVTSCTYEYYVVTHTQTHKPTTITLRLHARVNNNNRLYSPKKTGSIRWTK